MKSIINRKEIFLIIQVGFEGIDKIWYATTEKETVKDVLIRIKNIVISEKKYKNTKFNKEMRKRLPDWEDNNNDWKEIPERICVQKFTGKCFECCCKEFDVVINKQILYK